MDVKSASLAGLAALRIFQRARDRLGRQVFRAHCSRRATHRRLGDLRRRPRAQIGRASCRERVCQYVEISVVAVSLKKKNTTTDSKAQPSSNIIEYKLY